jgi:hypothetical protein
VLAFPLGVLYPRGRGGTSLHSRKGTMNTETETKSITHKDLGFALAFHLTHEKESGADDKEVEYLFKVFTDFYEKVTGRKNLI